MERNIEAREAARCLERLVEDLAADDEIAIVRRDGAPLAAVVPYSLCQALRDAGFASINAGAERAGMTEDEAMELALRVIAEDRAERRRPA